MDRPLSRYSSVAIALHWAIAALILTNIALAWIFQDLDPHGSLRPLLIRWHKSFGITVLLLSLLRLAWRLTHRPPPFPPMPQWRRWFAHAVHWGFYVIMIGMPLTGWIMSSATAHPLVLYNVIPWPKIGWVHHLPPPARRGWDDGARSVHVLLAKVAYGLLALHVGAALEHQFVARDRLLARMGLARPA